MQTGTWSVKVLIAALGITGMLGTGLTAQAAARRAPRAEAPAAVFDRSVQALYDEDASRAERLSLFPEPGNEAPPVSWLGQTDVFFKGYLGDLSFQRRMSVYGFLSGLLLLAVVAGGLYMLGLRLRSRREELVMKYQQEMLKMVRDLAASPGFSLAERPRTGYAVLPGIAEIIEPILPALVHPEAMPHETQDPVFQLVRIVFAGNLKERALAAARLLKLDSARALTIIRELISVPDPFQRESMAIALGEYYHPQTVDLLAAALRDPERRVAVAAYRALGRIARLPVEELPEDAGSVLKILLQQAPSNLRKTPKGGAL